MSDQLHKQLHSQLKQTCAKPLGETTALPFASYFDSSVYALEKQNIFSTDWVFVCAESELANEGDYHCLTFGDESIVAIRGIDNQLHALSNICQHRGTPILDEGTGNSKRLICPYHAWTYDFSGKLLAIPHAEKHEVNKDAHCLPEFSLEVWNGLVFVNLNNQAEPLSSRFKGIEKYLSLFEIERFDKAYPSQTEIWDSNWKLAMENAMESYHLFKVHKETLETVTPTKKAFYLEGFAEWAITAGKMENIGNRFLNSVMGTDKDIYQYYILISLPPSFVGIITYESFDWISVHPKSETQCTVKAGGINAYGSAGDTEQLDFVKAFFAEDKDICERIQTGMKTQHNHGGTLVNAERIVVDFHQYLGNRLFGTNISKLYQSKEAELFLK